MRPGADSGIVLFRVLLAVWLLVAAVPVLGFPQDAASFVAAGDLVRSSPEQVYGSGVYGVSPAFAELACRGLPAGDVCEDHAVSYLSMPLALPLAWLTSLPPTELGHALLRLVSAGALVAGMALVARRLRTSCAEGDRIALVTAICATPFAISTIAFGTTSTLLFLSAAYGIQGTERGRRGVIAAALWTTNVVLRAFPLVLAAVLVWCRRWQVLGFSAVFAALLALGWLAIAPAELAGDFVDSTRAVSDESSRNPNNGALDAALHQLGLASADRPFTPLSIGLRVVLVGGSLLALTRMRDLDLRWAYAPLVVLLAGPTVWLHYLWLGIPAIGLALRGRAPAWVVLPGYAACCSVVATDLFGTGGTVLARFALLLAALVATPLLAGTAGSRAAPADTASHPN